MADHIRKRVRDAAATALTGLATTGSNVFVSRVTPLQAGSLPALRISTPSDLADRQTMGRDPQFENTLTLQIEYCVKSLNGYEDTVDQIEKEVFIALAADVTLGGVCKSIFPGGYESELDGEGDQPIAIGRRQFAVTYFSKMSAPDVSL